MESPFNDTAEAQLGASIAWTMLVGQALAIAARGAAQDPRGALRYVLLGLEASVPEAVANAARAHRDTDKAVDFKAVEAAALSTVSSVSQVADAYLHAMGAPPPARG